MVNRTGSSPQPLAGALEVGAAPLVPSGRCTGCRQEASLPAPWSSPRSHPVPFHRNSLVSFAQAPHEFPMPCRGEAAVCWQAWRGRTQGQCGRCQVGWGLSEGVPAKPFSGRDTRSPPRVLLSCDDGCVHTRVFRVWEAEECPPKMSVSHPPGTFTVCYLVWQRDLKEVMKSRVLGRGDYPYWVGPVPSQGSL